MLRHATAPAHAFAQIPNIILRHPRLSSDAKNLLNWQLSLPADEKQCLSDTALKAGIKKCAFQKAKRQLLDEGYLHQWTVRTDGGLFATVQLISNTALSAKEALAVRDGIRPAPGGARLTGETREQPTAAPPAARQPTGPSVGRLPKNTRENTSQPTTAESEPDARPEPQPDGVESGHELRDAEELLRSLAHIDPRLAMPARTARRWAPLAAPWLACGLTPERIRRCLTQGLSDARSPLGLVRWRLEHALPELPPPPSPAAPKPEPRVTAMRECRTRHTQPRLFTPPPGTDEDRCPDCRAAADEATEGTPRDSDGSGYTAFLATREAMPRRHPKRRAA